MKHLRLLPLLLGCLMIVPSCKKDLDPDADFKDTIEYLKEDYQTVVKQIPDADGYFIEAIYELSGKVSETDLKDLKPLKVTYLFQWVGDDDVAYLVSMERDFTTGKTSEIEKITTSSPWQDTKLGDFEGVISLEKALKNLKSSPHNPATAYVTLRKPVIPRTTLRYMLGDSVYVDALTGEVVGPIPD